MKLPVDRRRRLGLILFTSAAAAAGVLAAPLLARVPAGPVAPVFRLVSGPAADYPMVLGPAAVIDGVTYTPSDTMNYDQVGYAAVDAGAGPGVTLAHRTLPLPSYVEVTSLKTGRTILARVERRGPMSGADFVALSPGAAAQLGTDGRTPVRVRRVNPQEIERALLRAGQSAPARMDTPMSLVSVLQRKLDPALASPAAAPAPAAVVAAAPTVPPAPKPALAAKPAAGAKPGAKPVMAAKAPVMAAPTAKPAAPKLAEKTPAAKPAIPAAAVKARTANAPASTAPAAKGTVVVQVGAFSTREHAEAAARQVGGSVSPSGKLYRVRIAGFETAAKASGALAKVRGAGYSDARIQRAD